MTMGNVDWAETAKRSMNLASLEGAKQWLRNRLANGERVPRHALLAEAERLGGKHTTLTRAAVCLCLDKDRQLGWAWAPGTTGEQIEAATRAVKEKDAESDRAKSARRAPAPKPVKPAPTPKPDKDEKFVFGVDLALISVKGIRDQLDVELQRANESGSMDADNLRGVARALIGVAQLFSEVRS